MSSRSLRVALVAPYDLSQPGGVNTQIRAQKTALQRLGHHVRVYGPASGPVQDGEISLGSAVAISLFGTTSGFGLDPRSVGHVGRMLHEPLDVLHLHEPFMPLPPWIALARTRVATVGTFHVHREDGHRVYGAASWLLRPLARALDARIAVSEAARRTVEPHFPGHYDIVPNGIDIERFVTRVPRPDIFEPDRFHVVYVGRLEPRKGVEYLVRAMAEVQRQHAYARLIVGGDGPDRERLTRLAATLAVDARFAGAVSEAELPAYFQSADLVCSPATGGESFGVVLLEAMAAGRPVIASRIAGYAELVGDRGCARLVAPADAGALARAILDLLEQPAARARLAAAGLVTARAYDWKAIAIRVTEIYESARVHRRDR